MWRNILTQSVNTSELSYVDDEGVPRTIDGLSLSVDKAGRMWLWSEQLEHNLAYKYKNREHLFLAAIDSLLFTISLMQEKVDTFRHFEKKLDEFLEAVRPSEPQEY